MGNGHGGARRGAGRKPKPQKHGRAITRAEKQIVDRLPAIVEEQIALALGGRQSIAETYEAAGTVTVMVEELDPKGKKVKRTVPAFPDLNPDELVLVRRVVTTHAPDRAAGQYLQDRIMGKPTERHEVENTGDLPLVVTEIVVNKSHDRPMDDN